MQPGKNTEWNEDKVLNRKKPPYGPRNTVSNVAYLVAGWASGDIAFAALMTLLAAGSALYHAFRTNDTNAIDIAGMFGVFAYLALGSAPLAVGAWLVGAVLILKRVPIPVHAIIGTGLVGALIRAGPEFAALYSLLLFVFSYVLWSVDRGELTLLGFKILDLHPVTGLWGHAAWHVFTALAAYVMHYAVY